MEIPSEANNYPKQYGRYQIIAELGHGSMGVVYKAHDPYLDRPIALKVLREDRITSDFIRRFEKEAKAIARLAHPGIVTVHDVGQDHNSIYIAMEFLQGSPLDNLMEERKFLLEEILGIALQSAQALHYAHRHGVIHRDIKPSNIIYSPKGNIRITDFGIAHIEDPSGLQMTQVGEILGTPRYMSPEQFMGQTVDGRSDYFSLGVILYQLTTGKRPFDGPTQAAIFQSILQDLPETPHILNPAIPEPLSAVIMRLLEKEPSNRFADGEQLIEALQACLPVPPAHRQMPWPPSSEVKKGSGKGTMLIAGIACCIVIGLAAAGYYFFRLQPVVVVVPPNTVTTDSSAIALNELLLEGTALSISVIDLPKKEEVLKSAQDLSEVSPRYQEDLKIAEATYNAAKKHQERKLSAYLDELTILSHTNTASQIARALERMKNENLSERQKNTVALIEEHLRSLQNGATLNTEQILNDFSQRFNSFVD